MCKRDKALHGKGGWVGRSNDRLTHPPTDPPIPLVDWPTDRPTYLPTHSPTNFPPTDPLTNSLTEWLSDLLTYWLGWLSYMILFRIFQRCHSHSESIFYWKTGMSLGIKHVSSFFRVNGTWLLFEGLQGIYVVSHTVPLIAISRRSDSGERRWSPLTERLEQTDCFSVKDWTKSDIFWHIFLRELFIYSCKVILELSEVQFSL